MLKAAGGRPAYFPWFVAPAVLLALVLAVAMASLLQYTFRQHVPGSIQVGGFTLENFGRMSSWVYLRVFIDSLLLSAYTAFFSLLLGYPLALALVRTRSALLKSTIMIVTIIPLFTGDIVRTYSWLIVLGKHGFINGSLKWLGLIDTPFELLYTMLGVTVALVQYSLPVMVIVLAAAISHINPDYEKAATSLGAGSLSVLWHVTLPLSMPGILAGTVTIFAWTLSAFATPQLVGGGKVNMVSNMVYQLGFSNFDFPFAATLSLVSLALIFAILGVLGAGMRRLEARGIHQN
jgi:putative spermidine/putrescine transport system permease protein